MSSSPAMTRAVEPQLVSMRITVDPPFLEDLLECLADLDIPIDPTIQHANKTRVQFVVEAGAVHRIRRALHLAGFHRIGIS